MPHPRFTRLLLFFTSVLWVLSISCDRAPQEPGYFHETGPYAIYQRALDLQNDINVMSVALEPGFEDLETLAYFRLGRGANISSVYLTNGEAGESDIKGELPDNRAVTRREEARDAIAYLDGEAYFLNFSDIRAYHDLAGIENAWPRDDVKRKISELILKIQPDVVLVARDWCASGESLKTRLLREITFGAVKLAAAGYVDSQQDSTNGHTAWEVDRVVIDNGKPNGMTAPVDNVHPRWGKTYHKIAVEAANAYKSIAIQREKWMASAMPSYSYVFSEQPKKDQAIDAGLPIPASSKLRRIEQGIQQLTADAISGKKSSVLKEIVTMMDSVTLRMPKRFRLNARENRSLLAWKKGLDDLRNALLGIKVHFTISDTSLTGVQVTYLNISNIDGVT
ncbi:MAG: PIG-L family deacetylase, partial [bacterium]